LKRRCFTYSQIRYKQPPAPTLINWRDENSIHRPRHEFPIEGGVLSNSTVSASLLMGPGKHRRLLERHRRQLGRRLFHRRDGCLQTSRLRYFVRCRRSTETNH
jgi:hypothetical protein